MPALPPKSAHAYARLHLRGLPFSWLLGLGRTNLSIPSPASAPFAGTGARRKMRQSLAVAAAPWLLLLLLRCPTVVAEGYTAARRMEQLRLRGLRSVGGVACSADAPLVPGGKRALVTVMPASSVEGARSFLLSLPPRSSALPGGLPLLMPLHGGNQDAHQFLDENDFETRSLAAGFIVASPQSLRSRVGNVSWWTSTMTRADTGLLLEKVAMSPEQEAAAHGEIAFLFAVCDCLQRTLALHIDGVYVAGYSQGSRLASQFACASPLAALQSAGFNGVKGVIATGSIEADAAVFPHCARGKPPPMLVFQAQEDMAMPFCRDSLPYGAGQRHFLTWAQSYAGCATGTGTGMPLAARVFCGAPFDVRVGYHAMRAYVFDCSAAPLAMMLISDNANMAGHSWPRSMAELGGRDATAVMLQFFEALRNGTGSAVFEEALQLRTLQRCAAVWPCDKKELAAMDKAHWPMLLRSVLNLTAWGL